jgi:hypothetical protein
MKKAINTGFKRHIDILVDQENERPDQDVIDHCRRTLGPKAMERWFDVRGRGYGKDWMWVMGA